MSDGVKMQNLLRRTGQDPLAFSVAKAKQWSVDLALCELQNGLCL